MLQQPRQKGEVALSGALVGLSDKLAACTLASRTLVLFDCYFLLLDTSVPDVEKAMSSDTLPGCGLEDKRCPSDSPASFVL